MKRILCTIIILGMFVSQFSFSSTETGDFPLEGQDIEQNENVDKKQSRYARLMSAEWTMEEIIGYYDDNKTVFQNIVADLLAMETPNGLSLYLKEDDSIFQRTLVENSAPIELCMSAETISNQMQTIDVISIQKDREGRVRFVITEGVAENNYEQGLLYDPNLLLTQMEEHIDGDWYWYSVPHT